MTVADAGCAMFILMVLWLVIWAQRLPLPQDIFRRQHVLRIGVDDFTIIRQCPDGKIRMVGSADHSHYEIGDLLFIQQAAQRDTVFHIDSISPYIEGGKQHRWLMTCSRRDQK
jgi:hypothetical protein